MSRWIITIDGPAGVGKSTAARRLAEAFDAVFLDTGATYRAVTLAAMLAKADLTNPLAVMEVMDETEFAFYHEDQTLKVVIDGQDATAAIRSTQVTENVKFIASQPQLRKRLVQLQRQFAARFDKIVTEGRDQGTVVFPEAKYKFFLIADPKERARRRYEELKAAGNDVDFHALTRQIAERDSSDETRTVGPLKAADDAVTIDTTAMDIDGVIDTMLQIIRGHHG